MTLSLATPRSLEQGRAKQGNNETIDDFFDKLEKICGDNDISATTMWNADEKGFIIDPLPQKVVTKKILPLNTEQHRRSNDQVTTLIRANAAGQVLPPHIIYPRKQLRDILVSNGPEDALYSTSPNGGMSSELFLDWFEQVFLPATNRERTQVR